VITTQSRRLFVALALALAAPGCKATPFEPPFEKFEPGVWKGPKGASVPAPDAANTPWRVMVLQEQPRPKKNPLWKKIPVAESGYLEMPERSSFKCLYNPAVYRPAADEFLKGVEVWEVLRGVRCSNDGFRTYTEALFVKPVNGDGTYVPRKGAQAELSMIDLIMGKRVRITILLRAD
jgi:hypothetical protein